MAFDPKTHHRPSTRLKSWDYSWPWWYYVTVCSHERECIFGKIVDDEMRLNSSGQIIEEEWLRTPQVRREIELDMYVVMPNHFHGIVIIGESVRAPHEVVGENLVGAHGCAPLRRKPLSLGSFIAGFKSVATKRINELRNTPGYPVWQRGFHDHIIRNEADLARDQRIYSE